jgi:hypothetical protein
MITSKEVLKQTGLKSAKTLNRWANAGIIPKAHIGTHPNGRGKIAYWPDSVLARCRRIVQLQKSGHTLSSALVTIEHERLVSDIAQVSSSKTEEVFSNQTVKLSDDRQISLASFVTAFIINAATNVVSDLALRAKLATALRSADVAAVCWRFVQAGYNPVCLFDGDKAEVVPDFVVSHKLSELTPSPSPFVVIPAVGSIRKALSALGHDLPQPNTTRPAPKVWAQEGGAIVEYSIFLGGGLGFELIRESAETIGQAPSGPEVQDQC